MGYTLDHLKLSYPTLAPCKIDKWFYRRNRRFRWEWDEKRGWWTIKRKRKLESGFRYVNRVKSGKWTGMWRVQFRWWRTRVDGVHGRKPDYEFSRCYREKMAAVYVANLVWQALYPERVDEFGDLVDSRYLTDSVVLSQSVQGPFEYFLYVHGDPRKSSIQVNREFYLQMRHIPLFWRDPAGKSPENLSVFFLMRELRFEDGLPRIKIGWVPLQSLFERDLDRIVLSEMNTEWKPPVRRKGSDVRNYMPESFVGLV